MPSSHLPAPGADTQVLLQAIHEDSVFRLAQVDIHTPEGLKDKFCGYRSSSVALSKGNVQQESATSAPPAAVIIAATVVAEAAAAAAAVAAAAAAVVESHRQHRGQHHRAHPCGVIPNILNGNMILQPRQKQCWTRHAYVLRALQQQTVILHDKKALLMDWGFAGLLACTLAPLLMNALLSIMSGLGSLVQGLTCHRRK